jgi:hypothetical protein
MYTLPPANLDSSALHPGRTTMSRLFNPVARLLGTPMLCLEALRWKGSLSKRGTEDELRVSARLPKATAFLPASPFLFESKLTSGGCSSAVPIASPVCESFFNRERQPTNPTTPSQTRSSPGTGGVAGLRKQRCVNHSRVVDLLLARPASIRGCTGGRSTATTSARMLLANRTKPRRQMMNRNVRAVLQICERLPIMFVPSSSFLPQNVVDLLLAQQEAFFQFPRCLSFVFVPTPVRRHNLLSRAWSHTSPEALHLSRNVRMHPISTAGRNPATSMLISGREKSFSNTYIESSLSRPNPFLAVRVLVQH